MWESLEHAIGALGLPIALILFVMLGTTAGVRAVWSFVKPHLAGIMQAAELWFNRQIRFMDDTNKQQQALLRLAGKALDMMGERPCIDAEARKQLASELKAVGQQGEQTGNDV